VVSLAAAFGLPLTLDDGTPLPGRDIVLFITFVVVIATLVLQGFTLPAPIRRLGVVAAESASDNLAEAGAQQAPPILPLPGSTICCPPARTRCRTTS